MMVFKNLCSRYTLLLLAVVVFITACHFSSIQKTELPDILQGPEARTNLSTNSSCLDSEKSEILKQIWLHKKEAYKDEIERKLPSDPYVLYNIESQLINFFKSALFCNDKETLDQLAQLLLIPLNSLTDHNRYLFHYPPNREDAYEVRPVSQPFKGWITKNESGKPNAENKLAISQFLYFIAYAIHQFATIPAEQRTNTMNDLIFLYSDIVLNHHYTRWIFSDDINGEGTFQVRGWSCNEGTFNHLHFLEHKLNRRFGRDPSFGWVQSLSYCNAITDTDTWIVAGVVEMLAAHAADPRAVPMDQEKERRFQNYVRIATELIRSRLTPKQLIDFNGNRVIGLNFDLGTWAEHPEYEYAGYSGDRFPSEENKRMAPNVGWDISHANRFVEVFETLYQNRIITKQVFPTLETMKGLANQLIYGAFNGNFAKPRFSNFMDGTDGWFRINYEGAEGFGYYPSSQSKAITYGGYGFWSKYNSDIQKVIDRVWEMIEGTLIKDQSGNLNDLETIAGNGSWHAVPGKSGKGFTIDAASGHITSPILFGDDSEMTIMGWFFPTAVAREIQFPLAFPNGGLCIRDRSWAYWDSNVGYNIFEIPVQPFQWTHVAITWENSGTVRVFINGEDITSFESNIRFKDEKLTIGSKNYGVHKFHGRIDEVQIFNKSLSREEVALAANQNGLREDLAAYWSFDEGVDNQVVEHIRTYYGGVLNHFKKVNHVSYSKKSKESLLLQFLSSFAKEH